MDAISPLQNRPDRRGRVVFRIGRPKLLEIIDKPREEPLALGRQKRHRLGGLERLERLAAPGKMLKDRRRLGRTDARQKQEHPPPRGLVARVEHDPQMGEHILDVSLLEKPQPAADRVRDVPRQQLALQKDAVVMIAIEHRHLAQRQALVAGFEDLLADERGLLVGIGGGNDQGKAPIRTGGDQVFAEIPIVLWAIEALVKATIWGVER